MKIILASALLFLAATVGLGQSVASPKVSKQVELVGIIFRLAEVREYSHETYKDYTDAIQTHFGPHKGHKAVALAKQLNQNGAGYSYVASLAVHLTEPGELKLAAPMSKGDLRAFGGQKNIDGFLAALRDFYRVSNFEGFWAANQGRYAQAERNFEGLSKSVQPEWFDSFYGVKFKGNYKILVGMGNGPNFYGPSVTYKDGSRDIFAVFAPLIEEGEPRLPSNALVFTIHEFNHSFANPLIDRHEKKFEHSASKLFAKVEKEMSEMAYKTWKIVMYESLVRAATNTYLLKYNPNLVAGNRYGDIFEQKFVWTDAYTDLFKEYEAERGKYNTLDSFVPNMTAFFERAGETDLAKYVSEFEKRSARVIRVDLGAESLREVDPELSEIRIVFDRPLDGKGISVNVSERDGETFPKLVGGRAAVSFANGNTEFVIKVKLEPNTSYGFVLTGKGFQTPDRYPLKQYEVSFKTK
jgi:hypothetical protein